MIVLKSARELEIMKEAGRISAGALMEVGKYVKPGVSTLELDEICYDYIKREGAEPNFLHLYDFPNTACISVNDEIIHGIPSKDRILKEGDIVSVDTGAKIDGYNGDNAYTFYVGEVSPEVQRLCETTREALLAGIAQAVPGNRSTVRVAVTVSFVNTKDTASEPSSMRSRVSPTSGVPTRAFGCCPA